MANLKDTIVLGNLTVTGKITGDIQSSGGTGGALAGVSVTGSGNAITSATYSGNVLTLDKGSTFLTSVPTASSSVIGGIKLGYTADGANIPVQLSSNMAYVTLTKTAVTTALGYTPPTTDSNTTYSLSKSGSTITLTGSDGSTTSVTDDNTTTTIAQGGYADYLTGFSGRNGSISWGTLAKSGYTFITRMDTANGGSIAFADKSGQTSMQVDGFFYQNEGNYKVLDESGGTISDKLNFTYGGTRRLRLWADGEGANIRMTTPGNANNCYEIDTCENILRLYYSTDDGGGANYKSLTLMDANGVTNFQQMPTYKGTNLVVATDLNNYVDKTSTQTISGAKTFTAANNFTGETLFTHSQYAPAWKDIAAGIGKSSCFTRGAFMQLITGQILLPNATYADSGTALDTTVNTLKFQSMRANEGQPVTATIATLNSSGDFTGSGYVRGSYFTSDGACGIRPSGGNEINLSGSGNVIYFGYTTATGANPVYTYVFCNGSSSTAPNGTVRAATFTQTANNYRVVDCTGGSAYHIRVCSASEFNNLTKDSNTLYFIK